MLEAASTLEAIRDPDNWVKEILVLKKE